MADKARERQPYVLVVDDTPAVVALIRRLLARAGVETDQALGGSEALAKVAGRRPDLILLDVEMPELSGFEVCRRLKENRWTAAIPIIFLTGKTDTASVVEGFAAGGVDYVTKPFQPEELAARVRTHVQLHLLRSILPICSYCNKIRNSDGDWERMESYLLRQTGTCLSHGVCPGCYEKAMEERPRP